MPALYSSDGLRWKLTAKTHSYFATWVRSWIPWDSSRKKLALTLEPQRSLLAQPQARDSSYGVSALFHLGRAEPMHTGHQVSRYEVFWEIHIL